MVRIVLAFLALTAAPVSARQGVKITLTDGKTVEGDLQGYEEGHYKIRVGDEVRSIPEGEILDVVLTGEPLAEPAPAPAAAARAALEQGELEAALEQAAGALAEGEKRRRELSEVIVRAFSAQVGRLAGRGDAAGIAEAFRKLPPGLDAEARRVLIAGLAEHLGAADEPVARALAEGLAPFAEAGAGSPEFRAALADRFVEQARREVENKNYAGAAALLEGAARTDPGRAEALRSRAAEWMLPVARGLRETGSLRDAAELVRRLLRIAPDNADARRLQEELEFALLQQDAEALPASEAAALLKEFLSRPRRTEHKEWAARALARLADAPAEDPAVSEQLRRYFPVKIGRYLLYERADGKIRQKVRTDSVLREGGVLRVLFTLQDIYGDFSTSRVYPLEIERDAVILATGKDREPLLRFPLRAGETWGWRSHPQEFRRTVKAVGESVEVGPPGSRKRFDDCVVIEFTSVVDRPGAPAVLASRSTYAPDVGLIKLEFLDPDHRKYGIELIEAGQE